MTPSNPNKPLTPITQTFNSTRDIRVTGLSSSINSTSISLPVPPVRTRSEGNNEQIFYDDRKLAHDILMGILIVVLMLIPVVILEFVIEPFQRGFFCDDESIRYPFQDNTVTFLILILMLMIFPIPLIVGVELMMYYRQSIGSKEYISCFGWKIPTWLFSSLRHYFYYVFGIVAVLDLTEIGKFTIGRLRPHFMAVCQPAFPDGSSCQDPQNQNRYIDEYICLANNFLQTDVRQARLSFPSGHASLTLFSMLYLVLYMETKLKNMGPKLIRHFIQLILLMFGWFTSLSRVMDNWHHWSDVLVGMLLGIAGAIVTAKYISKLFNYDSNSSTSFRLNSIPRHDTTATLQDVL